jgi:manganese transport protein
VPLARALGPVGLAVGLLGFLAATIAAAAECTLSVGYSVAQYFGWSWGKDRRPADAPRFQLVCWPPWSPPPRSSSPASTR